ncbi:MAG: hypothetical protein ACYC3H_04250 [Bellilinea sp.]
MREFLILIDPEGGEWQFAFLNRQEVQITSPASLTHTTSPQEALMAIADLIVLRKCTGRMHDRGAWARVKDMPGADVLIEVYGGVAYVEKCPEHIIAEVIDHDKEEDDIAVREKII